MTDYLDDDLHAAGDDYRDRTFEDRLNDLQELGYPKNPDDIVDYGFPIPYPPRPEDIA
jgi:hypothetical protein